MDLGKMMGGYKPALLLGLSIAVFGFMVGVGIMTALSLGGIAAFLFFFRNDFKSIYGELKKM